MGIKNKSGGTGKKMLSVKATKDKRGCEYFDFDLFSRNFFIFFNKIVIIYIK